MSTASSSSRPWVWVASLSAEQHASLRAGVNLLNAAAAPADEAQQAHSSDRQHQRSFPLILFRKDDGSIVVSKNQCRHNGGRFVQSSPEKSADGHQASVPASSGSSSSSGASCPPVVDMEDLGRSPVLTCSFHGWQLNAETLDYVKPPDCLKQEALRIDNSPQTDSGAFKIFQRQPYEPWKSKGTTHAEGHQQQQQAAQQVSSIAAPLDLKISYISHACVEISAGGRRLVTDPWLTGPSFGRGWWLLHEPPADAYERVASADAIYISHGHPDHFNIPTLRRIAAINPAVPLYIPQLSVDVFSDALQQLGFTNVRFTPMGEWQQLDGSSSAPGGPDDDSLGRFMILPDDLFPHLDTFLLFEYRGRRVLNLVDCCSPNGDHLPSPVDVLLTDFASGASGFPACFVEQFGEARATQMALDKAAVFLKKTAKHVQITQPQVWIPFAGYFTEAGPDDQLTLKVNRKNTPVGAATALRARVPSLRTWLPFPGGSYDVARKEGQQPDKPWEEYNKKSWNFAPYLSYLSNALSFAPLSTLEGVQAYFDWAGFHSYALLLHCVECSDDFERTLREFTVDFSGPRAVVRAGGPDYGAGASSCPAWPEPTPQPPVPIFRVRARQNVLRDTLLRGESWDNLYIGFSARFYAAPDTYHLRFWNHFNNMLPQMAPDFGAATEQQKPPNLVQLLDQWDAEHSAAGQQQQLQSASKLRSNISSLLPALLALLAALLAYWLFAARARVA